MTDINYAAAGHARTRRFSLSAWRMICLGKYSFLFLSLSDKLPGRIVID